MTSAPAIDVREHVAAVKAALDAQLDPWYAYGPGEVPGDPNNPDDDGRAEPLPYIFVTLGVERRNVPPRRVTGQAGRSSWRVVLVMAGRSVLEAQWAILRVDRALDEAYLTVAGETTTLIQPETPAGRPQWDDGRFTATATYTYTA